MKTKQRLRNILDSLEEIHNAEIPPTVRVPVRNAAVLIRLALSLIGRERDEQKGHD